MANDWFKPTKETAPRAKPKIGLLRLVLFAFIAFWLFSKVFKPQAGVNDPAVPGEGSVLDGAQTESQSPNRNLPRYDQPPSQGSLPSQDWKLDDIDSGGKSPADVPKRSMPRGSIPGGRDQSDWSIEEVETKKSLSNRDNETRFDPRGNRQGSDQNGKATKTTEGDWSIEEVETKKK